MAKRNKQSRELEEKLANYARKRKTQIKKMERLIAERDYIKREMKNLSEEMSANDNYLTRMLLTD